jgi:DNA-3-methyladenine glycosylase I
MKRCIWPREDALMIKYHDGIWGKPERSDKKIFEAIILDTFQAGLSWKIILHKRENFARAFDNFDYEKIANYTEAKKAKLLKDAGIIRNRLKIASAVENAKAFIKVRKEFGTFSKYIWGFIQNKPIQNKFKNPSEIPSTTVLSDKISKDMKLRGFKFCGSTVTYAFMQGIGMVNDHLMTCFCYKELK